MNVITKDNPIRVMLVDDSAVIRGLFNRVISTDPLLSVVSTASNGQIAINNLKRNDIDVIVLDLEMPVMDGLTALPLIMMEKPDVQVIIASTLTKRNAEISIRALTSGAKDYIPKPESAKELSDNSFQFELINKIKALGEYRRRKLSKNAEGHLFSRTSIHKKDHLLEKIDDTIPFISPLKHLKKTTYQLRKPSVSIPDIIAIGSSTGGPQALSNLLKSLSKEISLPILITQHMPATFTAILAEYLGKNTHIFCKEAQDGDLIEKRKVYIAPGGKHMIAETRNTQKYIKIIDSPPENFCKPSVDIMLRSLSSLYGTRLLTIILTGMGYDGLKGSTLVVENGGTVFAQDETSSVVWGMPGAVTLAGLCSDVIPLAEIPSKIHSLLFRSVA
jgi:two-component system, chemotaxis family, protein-glutamate methylesterase/glutaminase